MRLTLFPACDGDCVLISAGEGADHRTRVIVDGGRASTYGAVSRYFSSMPEDHRVLDLLVVSHVDADHIAGILKLVTEDVPPVRVREVWFNSHGHMSTFRMNTSREVDAFGPAQGDKLGDAITRHGWPWNAAFGGGAVAVAQAGATQRRRVGHMWLTVMTPTSTKLGLMEREWRAWSTRAGLARGSPDPAENLGGDGVEAFGRAPAPDVDRLAAVPDTIDSAAANGSSIAFLVEADDKRVLMGADAHPDDLAAAAAAMADPTSGRLRVDLLKVPHHGSRDNTTTELLSRIECSRFAFSTNGSRHSHPHAEAVPKILKSSVGPKTLYFNYRQPETESWDNAALRERYAYEAVFGVGKSGLLEIDV